MANNVIRLTESDLKKMIKECLISYLHIPTKSHKTIKHCMLLSDSMAEDVAYGNDVRNEYVYENLNEGLMMSYDINKSKAYLQKKFPNIKNIRSLQFNPYKTFGTAYYKPKNNDFVSIDLGVDFSNFKEIIDTVKNLLGWFTSEIFIHEYVKSGFISREFYNFDGDFLCTKLNDISLEDYLQSVKILSFSLIIEAKFGERYEPNNGEVFYHATERNKVSKILRQGLCPKSYGNFPERVYLGRSIPEIASMVHKNLKDMVIFQVDVSNINLYRDERNGTAVYTYDNIPPSQIKLVHNIQ